MKDFLSDFCTCKCKLELKSSGGSPPENCLPIQVIGTVTYIKKTSTSGEDTSGITHNYTEKTHISFNWKSKDDKVRGIGSQAFYPGEVFPKEVGEQMLGVIVFTQWGSMEFYGTHILKEKEE